MKKLFVLLLLCCYNATSLHAQQCLSLPDVDAISFNGAGYNIDVYTKIGPDQYSRKSLELKSKETILDKSSNMNPIKWSLNSHEDTLNRKDIDDSQEKFIEAKDLHTADFNSYIGKAFTVNDNGKWKREGRKSTYVLKFLRPELAIMQQLVYEDGKHVYNYSTLSSDIPDSVVTWRSTNTKQLIPLVLEIKGGKRIFLLYDRYIPYMIFPSPEGGIIYNSLDRLKPVEIEDAGEKYNGSKPYDFQYFNIKRHYGVQQTETGKYILLDQLGQNVLKEEYDSIKYDSRFIIAQRGNECDVFNLYLDKLNIGKPKVVKEVADTQVGCIEVLNEKGAVYYDEMGQEIGSPDKRWIGLCGTVPHWEHTILKKKGYYQLQIYTNGPGTPIDKDERYWLSDLLPTDSVAFLDGQKSFHRTGNSWIIGEIDMHPEWIRVGRKGKFGIVAYEYKQPKNVKPKLITKRVYDWDEKTEIYPTVKVTGKIIFPIDNDSIIMQSDGLIYFYKDNKVGIFPRDKAPVYDEIKQTTRSFYHITKNGIPGWLDIKTDKEYWE